MYSQVGSAQAISEGSLGQPKRLHISDRRHGASTVVKWALERIPLFLCLSYVPFGR